MKSTKQINIEKCPLGFEYIQEYDLSNVSSPYIFVSGVNGFVKFQPFYKLSSRCLSKIKINNEE